MKFSFDFPEPSVAFGDYRFGFLAFTDENTYGLDRSKLRAEGNGDALRVICDGFVWAGGQEKAPGHFLATLKRTGATIEWDVVVEMDHAIKTVSTIIRGVPRGQVSFGGGGFTDLRDGDVVAVAVEWCGAGHRGTRGRARDARGVRVACARGMTMVSAVRPAPSPTRRSSRSRTPRPA